MATRQERSADIFQLLRQDHQAVTSIIEAIRDADDQEKSSLCSRLEAELNQHMDLEEKYMYPILLDFEDLAELVQDAYSDHDSIKDILEQMGGQDVGSEDWESNFLALEDAKEDHVDTEENEVFPQAMELLSKDQISQITEQVVAAKQKGPQAPVQGRTQQRQPEIRR